MPCGPLLEELRPARVYRGSQVGEKVDQIPRMKSDLRSHTDLNLFQVYGQHLLTSKAP